MNSMNIIYFALLAIIVLAAIIWTIYAHRPKAPPPEPTLMEELHASIAKAVRMRIMHEGDAEYEMHMAKYFQAREARLREELEDLSAPQAPAVVVGKMPEGFLQELNKAGCMGPMTGAPE